MDSERTPPIEKNKKVNRPEAFLVLELICPCRAAQNDLKQVYHVIA